MTSTGPELSHYTLSRIMEQTGAPVTDSLQASATRKAPVRVSAACQRCRQQKLKCDVQRPCTLCIRAGVECTTPRRDIVWRAHTAKRPVKKARRTNRHEAASTDLEQTRCSSLSEHPSGPVQTNENDEAISADEPLSSSVSCAENDPYKTSSASLQFLKQALQQHDHTSPSAADTSFLAASQQLGLPCNCSTVAVAESRGLHLAEATEHQCDVSAAAMCNTRAEMMSILPTKDIAVVLVNNYFDKIHWFVLVFHQSDFRQQFEVLYNESSTSAGRHSTSIGFVGVFMAVCVLSLSHMDRDQISALSRHGGNGALLQAQLLAKLRSGLLDIAAESSIEAAQTCVLLGSYYVYQGQPQLAWPICGWSLRIAQALRLHRHSKARPPGVPDLDNPIQRAEETRKRCWWAVYEMETFCSMLYGYPLSINDDDCDVEPLCQYPNRSRDPTWNSASWRDSGQATLLSYKVAMARLSVIVRAALQELYSLSAGRPQQDACELHPSHRTQALIRSVSDLERKLHAWAAQLPQQLRMEQAAASTATPCEDYLHGRPGPCANACSHYLFHLQSLSLKLALENARILVHRPLLTYRVSVSQAQSNAPHSRTLDPCQLSIQTCQNAALRIANICSMPIMEDAGGTYAVAFICLHLLTASITLSILASLNSITPASHNCKIGLRRLMTIQSRLSGRSIVAKQGFTVSRKLMALLLEKEMEQMLDVSADNQFLPDPIQIEEGFDTLSEADIPVNGNIVYASALTGSCDAFSSQQGPTTDSSTSAEHVATVVGNDTTFTFREDLATMQALVDFEQAVLEVPNDDELQTHANLGAQDYSWIWGSNIDQYLPQYP